MRLLYTFEDRGGWGRAAREEAQRRGWRTGVIDTGYEHSLLLGAYAFMRADQREPRLAAEKAVAEIVAARGAVVVPDMRQIRLYEDKVAQAKEFGRWMPDTLLLDRNADIRASVARLGLPFISKAKQGSASHDVRLVTSMAQAEAEACQAFTTGIPGSLGVQRGYLLWQKFCAGNDYDYRVVVNAGHYMVLRRGNRADRPMASGSGIVEPITALTRETEAVLAKSIAFFDTANTHWCGIDLVRDPDDGEWKVLETTIGWKWSAYYGCAYFKRDGSDSGKTGEDQFAVLIDGMERSAFSQGAVNGLAL